MKTNEIKISVAIPVYNTDPKLVERCLKSVKNQTSAPLETLLINDGSDKDHTTSYTALTKKYSAILHTQKNSGVDAARHTAAKIAKGDFILYIDSDDYLAKDYIEKMAAAQKRDNADIVMRSKVRIENGKEYKDTIPDIGPHSLDDIVTDLIINNHIYSCIGVMFRKSFARKAPEGTGMKMGEDTLFLYAACKDAVITNASGAYYYYVIHDTNTTHVGYTSDKLKKHLEDNLTLYRYIRDDYPELDRVIDTALTSKAYDTLSFAMQAPKFRYRDYKALCQHMSQEINYCSDSVNIASFSRIKKIGIKLLAKHHYYASYRLNRFKDFLKKHR